MRYVLIFLGLVTIVLAVVLAWEQQWWAAIPDGGFGVGVAWVAWVSLRDEKRELRGLNLPGSEPGPAPINAPPPPPRPAPPSPAPTLPSPPASPPVLPRPKPKRRARGKRR